MLTHHQRTQIKLGYARRKDPHQIAEELGIKLADVQSVLRRRAPRLCAVITAEPARAFGFGRRAPMKAAFAVRLGRG